MAGADLRADGRLAFSEQHWIQAFELLTAADGEGSLEPNELDCLATVAYLVGRDSVWKDAWARAHRGFVEVGDQVRAARCAFWLGFGFINAGEMALAGGWFGRAQRGVEEAGVPCAERGYLLLPAAIEGCDRDPADSLATFVVAMEIGERFADRDLIALARHGQGRALIRLGEPARGMALLDEVLVAVTAGELSPIVTGDVYCGAIEACQEVLDVPRAAEWTDALNRWCESQPDLVPYRGQCLVYRSIVFQARGAWSVALGEAIGACRRLVDPVPHPAVGAAFYQCAEIHRLRGEFAQAERAYRQSDQAGRDPQPGLALLRLAEGQAAAAAAGIRRVLQEAPDVVTRSRLLLPAVEILLAVGDLAAARARAEDLARIAVGSGSRCLDAMSRYATGLVLLADGDAGAALNTLRRAHDAWRALDMPHDAARARVALGQCCRELGDEDGAALQFETARQAFAALGAKPDAERLANLWDERTPNDIARLSARELEVLRLVARGKTNRAIGDDLIISEKTVARHVSNIFVKLGVSTRSAATAYAYDHQLI